MDPERDPAAQLLDAIRQCLVPLWRGSGDPPAFELSTVEEAVRALPEENSRLSANSPLFWFPFIARAWVTGINQLVFDWSLKPQDRDQHRRALIYGPGGQYAATMDEVIDQFEGELGTPLLVTEAQEFWETVAGSYVGMWADTFHKWFQVRSDDRETVCRSLVASGLVSEADARRALDVAKGLPRTPFPKVAGGVAFDSAPARRKRPEYVEGKLLATPDALIFRGPSRATPTIEIPYSEIQTWRVSRAGTGLILRRLRIQTQDNARLDLQIGKRAVANIAAILAHYCRATPRSSENDGPDIRAAGVAEALPPALDNDLDPHDLMISPLLDPVPFQGFLLVENEPVTPDRTIGIVGGHTSMWRGTGDNAGKQIAVLEWRFVNEGQARWFLGKEKADVEGGGAHFFEVPGIPLALGWSTTKTINFEPAHGEFVSFQTGASVFSASFISSVARTTQTDVLDIAIALHRRWGG